MGFKSILYRFGRQSRPSQTNDPVSASASPPASSPPSPPTPRPDALKLSPFNKLPPEIITHISRFLPPESAFTFSLSCRPIHFTLEPQVFENLNPRSQVRCMRLLAQDVPNHIFCTYCEKLHTISKAPCHIFLAYKHEDNWLPCWEANHKHTLSRLHRNFSFIVFQMAMKRYHNGLDYSDLLTLLSCRKTCDKIGYVKHYSVLPRIINGSMLVREQQIALVPLQGRFERGQGARYVGITICQHVSLHWEDPSDGFRDLLEKITGAWGNAPMKEGNWKGRVRRCRYCPTDYALEFQRGEDHEPSTDCPFSYLGREKFRVNRVTLPSLEA